MEVYYGITYTIYGDILRHIYIYYGRYITADVLAQIDITADILRQVYYSICITAGTLRQIYVTPDILR